MMKTLFLSVSAALIMAGTAFAQTSHGIAAVVNDDIVTTHDLRQRTLFMIATTGVKRDEESIARAQQQALRNLVDEHIQMQESEKYEQTISDDQVNQASRNSLDAMVLTQMKLYSVSLRLAFQLKHYVTRSALKLPGNALSMVFMVLVFVSRMLR